MDDFIKNNNENSKQNDAKKNSDRFLGFADIYNNARPSISDKHINIIMAKPPFKELFPTRRIFILKFKKCIIFY